MRFIITLLLFSVLAFAVDSPPIVNLSVAGTNDPAQFVKTINIAVILTLMVLAPTLILMVTSFTRIIIVFSLLKQAMGLQQTPPAQVIVSLALVLTMFIMEPYAKKSWEDGVKPYMDQKIGYEVAWEKGIRPFKDFMIKNGTPFYHGLFSGWISLQSSAVHHGVLQSRPEPYLGFCSGL